MSKSLRSKLNAREQSYLREVASSTLALRYDYERRLRNALLCLTQSDPRWITWLEKEFKPNQRIGAKELLLIEARARCLVLRGHYVYSSREHVGWLLFRHDWPFSDSGHLSPG